jgi:co-chaperonin GroES (HSP10)
MIIEPTKNNLFIEVDQEGNKEEETEGGILLPKTEKTYIMDIAVAGPNELGIKAGDKVLVNPNVQLIEFRIGAKYYNLLPISYVLALIKDEN